MPDEAKATVWKGHPDDIAELLVATARATLRTMLELAALEGIHPRYVRAHRQASGTRRSDPGEGLWREGLARARP